MAGEDKQAAVFEPSRLNNARWYFWHFLCFLWFVPCYRYRAWGFENIPVTGPVIYLSNHQSFLDPIAVGLAAHRRKFYALARSSLFRNPLFSWLIRSLYSIPVERGTSDIAAMRKCIDVLNKGNPLLVFPEGTRTLDGKTQVFAPGTMLLIKRARPMIVPVAIEGSFAAWPKGRKLPRAMGRIGVMYGKPIPASQLIDMDANQALTQLRDQVESMRLEVARRIKV